MTEIPDSR